MMKLKQKRVRVRRAVSVLVVVAIVGFGAHAFAGRGYRNMNWGSQGGGGYGPCGGSSSGQNLSNEDVQKFQEERNAFFDQTADLRQQIEQKHLALRYELSKKVADLEMLKSIQKELSGLQAQLDEKRIEHMVEMKKINPNAGSGWMGGRMGSGRGYGKGFKHGPRYGMGGHQGPMMGWGGGWNN